jgi:uncharacterized repeat protein (TIGR01451 family)
VSVWGIWVKTGRFVGVLGVLSVLLPLLVAAHVLLSGTPHTHQVAVFDSTVPNIAELQRALAPGTRSIIIPAGVDGLSSLAAQLNGEEGITALHLFAHGAAGRMQLGHGFLDATSMAGKDNHLLRELRHHLAPEADILAYACGFGSGEEGARAAALLAQITGANVASSTDMTGTAVQGGNWFLERHIGNVQTASLSAAAWSNVLAVTITTNTNAAALASQIAAGSSGIVIVGTPTITTTANTTFAGTYTTSGSNLGVNSGVVLSTGNVTPIPGSPIGATNLSSAGTGVTAGATEYDVATLTFSFQPAAGVTRLSIASVFASEEYNEYVNTAFTDNFSMILNGGIYTNVNVATIPGTATGTDINTVNNGANAGSYRDNTSTTSPPIPDIKFDGATTVFINAFNVVGGTTYTLTIRIADVGDAQYDSAVFVSTSSILNSAPALDLSAALSGTGYTTNYTPGGAAVAIAAADDTIIDDGTTIVSATITLTNPQSGDILAVASLPPGVTTTGFAGGVMTLTGSATLAQYQLAIRSILYSNSLGSPSLVDRIITVVVNDSFANSNTATTTIKFPRLSVSKSASLPTVNQGASNTLTDAGDRITYTYVVTNSSAVALTLVSPVDPGPKFNGANGTGTLGAFAPVSATLAAGASQTFTAIYTLSAADVINAAGIINGVTNTATATGRDPGNAIVNALPSSTSTTITAVAAISVSKTAASPTTALGANATLTDAGDTITFFYAVTNSGSVTLTLVQPVDAGPKFNGINGTNTLSAFSPASVTLTAGASQTFTATYVLSYMDVANAVGVANGATNTATATGRNPSNVAINSPPSTASTTIVASPSLILVKSGVLADIAGGTATKADLNEVVTYSYVVQNNGNVPFTNVSITDLHGTPPITVPLGTGAGGITGETLSAPGPAGPAGSPDATANNGIWSQLAPGATVTFTWPHPVTQAEMDQG